jgi:DNA-binding GntR family transcriptional regulator
MVLGMQPLDGEPPAPLYADLDRQSPVALYEQIAAIMREQIDSGKLTIRLPSEKTLVQTYGVSRATAHHAMEVLVKAGYAVIRWGKGTYVVPAEDRKPPGQP